VLTSEEVAHYLRAHGLLDQPNGSEPEPAVVARPGRNSAFTVEAGSGSGYFLKQGVDAERSAGVAREAAIYTWPMLRRGGLGPYLAGFVHHDPEHHLIVLDLVAGGASLRSYHARGRFSITPARALGRALAALHRQTQPAIDLGADPPWVLSLHQPDLDVLLQSSRANVEMIKTLQRHPELGQHLDGLRHGWQPGALIHGDVRWDNCIVHPRPGSSRRTRLKLVDWELAQLGDPLWDVGCVFADYLSFWLMSIPLAGEAPSDRLLELSRYPIAAMQPAMRAFWIAYVEQMRPDAAETRERLELAARYAAARLVQTGFERSQSTPFLAPNVIALLQLSRNLLQEPAAAVTELIGIGIGIGVDPL
jgi:hypothetical protein